MQPGGLKAKGVGREVGDGMLHLLGQVPSSHLNMGNGRDAHAGRWRLCGIAGTFDYGESVSTTWPPWPIIPVAVFALLLLSPIYREILSRL